MLRLLLRLLLDGDAYSDDDDDDDDDEAPKVYPLRTKAFGSAWYDRVKESLQIPLLRKPLLFRILRPT